MRIIRESEKQSFKDFCHKHGLHLKITEGQSYRYRASLTTYWNDLIEIKNNGLLELSGGVGFCELYAVQDLVKKLAGVSSSLRHIVHIDKRFWCQFWNK